MSSKNKTQVIIAGKIYTLSGYESEEYLQKVAGISQWKDYRIQRNGRVSQAVAGDAVNSYESEYSR